MSDLMRPLLIIWADVPCLCRETRACKLCGCKVILFPEADSTSEIAVRTGKGVVMKGVFSLEESLESLESPIL